MLFTKNIFQVNINTYKVMNNTKYLKIIILLLILINLSTISFMWFSKPSRNDVVGDFFTRELQFTTKQKEQFIVLREHHRREREVLKINNKKAHDAFFNLLKSPLVDSIPIKKAVAQILKIKEKEEWSTFYHFQKVRSICNEIQKQKFDKIINEAARMMAPRPPKDKNGLPPTKL